MWEEGVKCCDVVSTLHTEKSVWRCGDDLEMVVEFMSRILKSMATYASLLSALRSASRGVRVSPFQPRSHGSGFTVSSSLALFGERRSASLVRKASNAYW